MPSDQKIRSALFYLGLSVFFIGLPFILSFALGYKFNPRLFKFSKTGLIDIKTQPAGARIYLDGKLLDKKTPASIDELLPGRYNLKVELEKFYPWASEVEVEESRVRRLDKIILFPLRPDIKQLNKSKISYFWMDEKNKKIYYVDDESRLLYRSEYDGEHFQKAAVLPGLDVPNKKYKISPDKDKLLIFSARQLAVVYLGRQESFQQAQEPVVLDFPRYNISDAFWHSDSFHIIIANGNDIEVAEAAALSAPVKLAALNIKAALVFYDDNTDTLYFKDLERAGDGNFYENVYRLELSGKFYPLQDLIKPKAGWEK